MGSKVTHNIISRLLQNFMGHYGVLDMI